MSTKSKATMETKEDEVKAYIRPSRNVKPVSYNENVKRVQGAESMADPSDKKKKKVNGDAKVNAPLKKTGKKKADTNGDKSSDNDVEDDEKPMPESRKRKNDVKPAADETSNSKKAPTSRKKKIEEAVDEMQVDDSKPTKAGTVKATKAKKATNEAVSDDTENRSETPDETENGDERPKPTKAGTVKATKGKKATNQAVSVDVDAKSATTDEAENGEEPSKPSKSKAGTTKGKKATNQAISVDTEAENATPGEIENGEGSSKSSKSKAGTTKATKGKKATNQAAIESEIAEESTATSVTTKPGTTKPTKGKKAMKESNAAVDDNEVVDASNNKARAGRPKKASAADQSKATKRKAAPAPTIITPKISRIDSVTNVLPGPTKDFSLKICSWNVAGLRALVKKDGLKFLKSEDPDMFCLQETKCLEEEVPAEAQIDGYHKYWHGMKGGHAGVALFTKTMPYEITYGIGDPEFDNEARLITAEYTRFFLLCVYVPNSGRKLINLKKRIKWDDIFQTYLVNLDKKKPVIVCGDFNVAHQEIDLANPKTNKRNAGFTQEERDGMTKMLSKGFIDTFRFVYPITTNAYTFWTYMANARVKNVGWRLDYFIVSERLQPNVVDNLIRSNIYGSDHCPVSLFLKF